MKRFILALLVMVAALAMVSSAGADNRYVNTCGLHGNPIGPPHTPGIDFTQQILFAYNGINGAGAPEWEVEFTTNCGYGGTLEYEVQHNAGSGYNDMQEWNGGDIDHQLTSPGTGDHFWDKTPQSLRACVPGDLYRVQFFWVDTNDNTVSYKFPSTTGHTMCS